MFRLIHKIIHGHKRENRLTVITPQRFSGPNKSIYLPKGLKIRKTLGSSSGQVAIILILVIAAALIFYAVTLNFGQISMSKTLTTVASNTSTGILASSMASYGQMLSETSLKGRREVCGWTGIVAVIIVIILIVVTIVSDGLTGPALYLALAGLAFAIVALAIQIVSIQPGLTAKWNRIIQETLPMAQQFNEGAIQNAFSKVVGDMVNVPDVDDMDGDRVWVPATAVGTPPYADVVSRYGVYYTEKRLKAIKDNPASADIGGFMAALFDFLYAEGVGDWGIHDPTPTNACGTAECNPCCVPKSVTIGTETFIVRPEACRNILPCAGALPCPGACTDCSAASQETYDDPARDAAVLAECQAKSPYGASYPWVYDFAHENQTNNLDLVNPILSFRELLGKDDEHRLYYKDTAATPSPWNPNSIPQNLHAAGQEGFDLEDAHGFYVPSFYNPTPPEPHRGIYPFFHKMLNWGLDLNLVDEQLSGTPISAPYDFLTSPNTQVCHWCDSRDAACPLCAGSPPFPYPTEIPQLILPLDPAIPTDGITYNTTYFVDGFDPLAPPSTNPPLAVDKILTPTNIMAKNNICAQETLYPPPGGTPDGFWKSGGDRFCHGPDADPTGNTTWPYETDCPKHLLAAPCQVDVDVDGNPIYGDCTCANNPAFADQFPDDAVDDLVYGLRDFIEFAGMLINDSNADTFSFIARFVDWYPDVADWIEPGPPATQSTDPPCFLCRPTEGLLWIWLKEMTEMRDRIQQWLTTPYAGTTCTEVWCVPDETLVCPEIPAEEAATFDTNQNGVRGDIEDITACLNYNVEGYDYVAAAAFDRCLTTCNAANCTVGTSLPAFHIDDGVLPLDGALPYDYPLAVLDCTGWAPGNFWYDAMVANKAKAVNVGNTNEGNDTRFQKCGNTCSLADCNKLPRSLVPIVSPPNYDPQAYVPVPPVLIADADWLDITAFNDCLNHCSPDTCRVGSRLPIVWSRPGPLTPYVYPDVTPGASPTATDCAVANWIPGNPWRDAVAANKAIISPPDEVDLAKFITCHDNCNVANCTPIAQGGLLPDVHTSNNAVFYTYPATLFDGAIDCPAGVWNAASLWYIDLINNMTSSGGVSCNPSPGRWLALTRQSAREARNQVAKFKKRRDFLKKTEISSGAVVSSGRLAEAENILKILDGTNTEPGAIDEFDGFLRGPAADLIRARINFNPNSSTGLPYQAVYGWMDPPKPPALQGKWHIVKVEARIPGICDNRCNADQVNPDPPWPRIRTRTVGWGTKRCYTLRDTSGVVKFRVTRYDEEKITGFTLFPNGLPVWRFRSAHPARPQTAAYDASLLAGTCGNPVDGNSTITTLPDGTTATTIYDGAFLMNEYIPNGGAYPPNGSCWRLAHKLLTRGVVTETCAQYDWDGPNRGGQMGFKFVPCQPF